MAEKYKKVFLRLLKEFNCYHNFYSNFINLERYIKEYNDGNKTLNHFLELSIKESKCYGDEVFYYIINDAFKWDSTKEKFDYWSKIARKMKDAGREIFDYDGYIKKEEIKYLKKILK